MPRKYAVALSYASQHRSLVHGVARRLEAALSSRGGKVFYDLYEKTELVGKIDDTLREAYVQDSDVVVVFCSQHYFQSEWCKFEWRAISRELMRKQRGSVSLLLLSLDNYVVTGLKNGYITTNVNSEDEAGITGIILNEAGVNTWIADARFAAARLNVLKRKRVHWLFDQELRLTSGDTLGRGGTDEWQAAPIAQLCRDRTLAWTNQDSKSLPANIVVLCGERGSGKSVLLLRAIASAGKLADVPKESWLVDFANNVGVFTDAGSFRSTPAEELGQFLTHAVKHRGKTVRHMLLAVDGLDNAARLLSVTRDEAMAPDLTLDTLTAILAKLREFSVSFGPRITFTVVVSLNAIDPSTDDQGDWQRLFEDLRTSGAVFASVGMLPAVDAGSYASLYRHHLGLKKKTAASTAAYVNDERGFLRLPLFLDAASSLDGGRLLDCRTRTDFLRAARTQRSVIPWPNELDRLTNDLIEFISTPSSDVLYNDKLRALLGREWTGGWLQLLTECMQSDDVLGFVSALKKSLLNDERWRWDLSASFALSNVVTALSEAGHAPTFETELLYCNLRRATLDKVVFDATSKFFGVDCSGARLREVKFTQGCLFVATDFTECVWDTPPRDGEAAAFIQCRGLPPPQ